MTALPVTQQSPQQKRALGLKQLFEAGLKNPACAKVGGNILIFVPNVATWTLLTQGARPTLKDSAGDDPIHFALSCDDFLLVQLMTGADVDLEEAVASGRLKYEGDVKVFSRFIGCIPS